MREHSCAYFSREVRKQCASAKGARLDSGLHAGGEKARFIVSLGPHPVPAARPVPVAVAVLESAPLALCVACCFSGQHPSVLVLGVCAH